MRYKGLFYFKLYCNVVVKIMSNHSIFRFYNVNLMRQESSHFTAMKTETYVNMSSFSNPLNLLRKYLVLCFNSEGFQGFLNARSEMVLLVKFSKRDTCGGKKIQQGF